MSSRLYQIVFLSVLLQCVYCNPKFIYDIKVKYFSDVSMTCDHPSFNITTNPSSVDLISWIFPDGSTVDSQSSLDVKQFLMSPPSNLSPAYADKFAVYNLTALRVSDDVFGYYTCVIYSKRNATNNNEASIYVVRWGLNVDGADFSELMEQYEKNGIVGGAAAAAMLLIVGGTCLIWQFRYSNRNRDDVIEEEKVEEMTTVFRNEGFNSGSEITEENGAK